MAFCLFVFLVSLSWLEPPDHAWIEGMNVNILILDSREKDFNVSLLSMIWMGWPNGYGTDWNIGMARWSA